MSLQRYENFNRIVQNFQSELVEGHEVSVISAHVMLMVKEKLHPENQKKLLALNLSVADLETVCWSTILGLLNTVKPWVIDVSFKQYLMAILNEDFITTIGGTEQKIDPTHEPIFTQPWAPKIYFFGAPEPLSLFMPVDFILKTKEKNEKIRNANGVAYPTPIADLESKLNSIELPKRKFEIEKTKIETVYEGFTIGCAESFGISMIAKKLKNQRDNFLSLPVDIMFLLSWVMLVETLNSNRCTCEMVDTAVVNSVSLRLGITWG